MKILALDIGSSSIKALYFDKKYRGHSIVNFSNTIIKRADKELSMDLISETINTLIKDNKYQPDKVVVLYPSDKTTHRFITLPFRDNKRIAVTLPLELEEQLPFDMEDIIYDWEVAESRGRNSKVLVAATRKDDYSGFAAMLGNASINTDLVIPGADPLTHLGSFLKLGKEYVEVEKNGALTKELKATPIVIVDLGCTKTTILVVKDGVPEQIRIINYGGDYITKKIMENYDLDYTDAERSKIEVGYIIMEGDTANYTEEQIGFSTVIKDASDAIIRDINQVVAGYKAERKESIQKCFLVGAGWKTRNFKEYMAHELRIPVESIEYSKALGVKLPFAGTPEEPVFASLIGFFIRFINKSTLKGFNFAKDKETNIGVGEGELYNLFKPTIRNVVIGMSFFLVYAVVHSFILSRIQTRYKQELETKFKTAFPDKDRKSQTQLLSNLPKLSREIDSRLKVQKAIIEGETIQLTGDSALTVLRDVSNYIPKDETIDVMEISIDGKNIKLQKVLVPNADSVQKIKAALETSGKFDNVKQGEIKQVQGGNKEFEITAAHKGGA